MGKVFKNITWVTVTVKKIKGASLPSFKTYKIFENYLYFLICLGFRGSMKEFCSFRKTCFCIVTRFFK